MNANKISKDDEVLTKDGIWYVVKDVIDDRLYAYGVKAPINVAKVVRVVKSADELDC